MKYVCDAIVSDKRVFYSKCCVNLTIKLQQPYLHPSYSHKRNNLSYHKTCQKREKPSFYWLMDHNIIWLQKAMKKNTITHRRIELFIRIRLYCIFSTQKISTLLRYISYLPTGSSLKQASLYYCIIFYFFNKRLQVQKRRKVFFPSSLFLGKFIQISSCIYEMVLDK